MNDYYSQKITKVRKQLNDMEMYKTQRENCQPRILQPVKISFNKWGLNKFLDKRELRECITSRSSPQEMLKDVLQTEEKWQLDPGKEMKKTQNAKQLVNKKSLLDFYNLSSLWKICQIKAKNRVYIVLWGL